MRRFLRAAPSPPPPPPTGGLVAFDLDGTLTWADSLAAFARWNAGRAGFWIGLVRLAPALARYLGDRDRGALKARMLRLFFRDVSRADMRRRADTFWSGPGARLLRADARVALDRARAHARVVIVSAAPEPIAAALAARLGVDAIATPIDEDARGITGLAGPNCRGPEKVRRLHLAYGAPLDLRAAYGDSDGDAEMIAAAREGGLRLFRDGPRLRIGAWARAYL